ncbi:MAG: hypothetical protein HKN79_08900 [Flavobacteriales bacterium]|nr:hypothetical protein [Flavobacteriales bacterium]
MTSIKSPLWFIIVAVIALLWNIMGLAAFISDTQMSAEQMAELPPAMAEAYANSPLWNWVAYGTATIFGFLGSLMLLLKKKIALPLLGLSLVGVIVQFFGWYFMTDILTEMGGGAMVMPALVVIVAMYLYFLSHKAKRKGWIA